ncbi:MAG: trimethylamine methyltransferase family protein, partial [Desulfamplus sp.]|nr:trimethylamine methyltransferase family protein [Desulfamplus sp.]
MNELRFRPVMKTLDDEQISTLHEAVLSVLERTGVAVKHPKAKEIFSGIGCNVDSHRVRIPPRVVEKAISSAPKKVVLGNRDNTKSIILEGANTYFGATVDCVNYLDPDTRELSECKSDHVIAMTRLCESLNNYDWTMTLGIARDMPESIADKVVARIAMEHCSKPVIVSANDAASLKEMYEMALLCRGGGDNFRTAPLLGTLNCTISPLSYDDHLVEKDIFAAENAIPIVHYSGMQLGASFPATLAGGIVMGRCHKDTQVVTSLSPVPPFTVAIGRGTYPEIDVMQKLIEERT